MRIPWPTDGRPILFQHGFEYLQARRDDQLLERGLRINEDTPLQRQVPVASGIPIGDGDGTVRDGFFMAAPSWEACTSVSSPVV